jgi:hypothetical protein
VSVRSLLDIAWLIIPPLQDTDVLYLRLLTTDFVVLNSTEAITDLPEKRSNIYCDRVSPLVKIHPLALTDECCGRSAGHADA